MKTRRSLAKASLLAVTLAMFRPALADDASSGVNAFQYLSSQPGFSDFTKVIAYAGLTQYASGPDKFTLFAPTDAGFAKYPDLLGHLLAGQSRAFPDNDRAVHFVRAHVLLDLHPLSEMTGRKVTLTSVFGTPITIDGTKPGAYTVTWSSVSSTTATAQISGPPIVTSNAIIYPVDQVVVAPNSP